MSATRSRRSSSSVQITAVPPSARMSSTADRRRTTLRVLKPRCAPSWMTDWPTVEPAAVCRSHSPDRTSSSSPVKMTAVSGLLRSWAAVELLMPAGTGKTRSASVTTYSCHVPLTPTVMTRCPTVRPSVPLPSSSITPTDSIPGTVGNSGVNPYLPRMVCRSLACTGTAATRIRIWPGPGSGIGRVCSCRTSDGSPSVSATTDRMILISLTLLRSDRAVVLMLPPRRGRRGRDSAHQ